MPSRAVNTALKAKRMYELFKHYGEIWRPFKNSIFQGKTMSEVALGLDEDERKEFCKLIKERPASNTTWDIVIAFLLADEENNS